METSVDQQRTTDNGQRTKGSGTTLAARESTRRDMAHRAAAAAAPPPRRRSAVVPWGLVGTIGLVILLEGTVSRHPQEFSDPVCLSWHFADRAARDDASGRDVLFLGDSLVKHGLIPSVLQAESGLTSVNLAAARAPALMTYFMLRRAIESGATPAAIIIDTKPAVLIGGAQYNAHYWPAALSPRECLELGWYTGKGQLGLATLTARLLPSLQSRLELRSSVRAALAGTSDPIHEINRVLWRNWAVNGGANVANLDSAYGGELSPEIGERLHPDRWYVDRSNSEGIERLLKLARRHGIPVFWLLPPISAGLQQWRERSGSEAKYEQFVRSFQERYPRVVTVLDARRVAAEASLYVDATHLSGRGATVLSRAVARALETELARPTTDHAGRWIALEDPSPQPRRGIEPALEDVERSKAIVRGGSL
jgi:hypothetical protein